MSKNEKQRIGRRTFLKATSVTPLLGAFAYSVHSRNEHDKASREEILDLGKDTGDVNPNILKRNYVRNSSANDRINLGFVGVGSRGNAHMRTLGFIPEGETYRVDPWEGNALGSEDLNIECTAVCDLYGPRLEQAVRNSNGRARAYRHYEDLIADPDVDAVVITTSDNAHAPIALAAARAGKHVYLEKCMTRTVEEAFALRKAVMESGVIFQLGHQNRNSNRYDSAMDVVARGFLGEVNLIQCYTNRNTPHGASYRTIPMEHGPRDAASGHRNVDWKLYQSLTPHPDRAYDPNRFFRWRCYWDYGTGIIGDLLTHELDVINMVMNLGIPETCVASGGIYHYKEFASWMSSDGEPVESNTCPIPGDAVVRPDIPLCRREAPDMLQVTYEWPERGVTVVYNATLASEFERGQIYIGNEGVMDLTRGVEVYADLSSRMYRDLFDEGKIDARKPVLTYRNVAGSGVEAITSATSRWTVGKGLLYTFREGRMISTTYLHHKNWLDHIRDNNPDTMCNIDDGFQEAITAHMATMSLLTGRRVRWDPVAQTMTTDEENDYGRYIYGRDDRA